MQSIADKPIKHEHRQLIRDKVLADTMETVCFYVTHSQVPPQRSPLYIDNSLKLLLLKRVNPHEQRVTLATPELVESDKLRDVLCSQGGSVEPFILVEVCFLQQRSPANI
jgi:phosphatidylserine/phosphatidylglycerophosphate/cardiolipin synthase-like enzyme